MSLENAGTFWKKYWQDFQSAVVPTQELLLLHYREGSQRPLSRKPAKFYTAVSDLCDEKDHNATPANFFSKMRQVKVLVPENTEICTTSDCPGRISAHLLPGKV